MWIFLLIFFQFELSEILEHPIIFQSSKNNIREFARQGDIGFCSSPPPANSRHSSMNSSVPELPKNTPPAAAASTAPTAGDNIVNHFPTALMLLVMTTFFKYCLPEVQSIGFGFSALKFITLEMVESCKLPAISIADFERLWMLLIWNP